jgi:hypothetical protein
MKAMRGRVRDLGDLVGRGRRQGPLLDLGLDRVGEPEQRQGLRDGAGGEIAGPPPRNPS